MRALSVAGAIVILVVGTSCHRDSAAVTKGHVAKGDQFFAQKKFSEAAIEYRNALAQDPNYGEARYKLAAAYENGNNPREALREYVRAADLMPKSINAQIQAAKLLLAAGQFPEAKARATTAIELQPQNATALVLLGNALAGLKDLDGAISEMREAVDEGLNSNLVYTNLGYLEMLKGNRAAAETALKRAVDVDPKSAQARLSLGNFYWALRDFPAAERELKAALELNPKAADANKALATFYSASNQPNRAEPYLKSYAEAEPTVTSKLLLADFFLVRQRDDDALAILNPMAATDDGFVPATLRLALLNFRNNRRPEAYQTIDRVLAKFPKNEMALQTQARFLINDRKFADAGKVAATLIEVSPRNPAAYYLQGVSLEATGALDGAAKSFHKVLELAPTATPAQVELATINLNQRNPKAAMDFVNSILKDRPTWGYAHFLFGKAQLDLGNLPRAESELLMVEKSAPKTAELEVALGRLYAAKQNMARARDYFNKALQLQPTSMEALSGLVAADLVEKKYDAARARVDAQVAARPNDPALLFLAANTSLTLGDHRKAESQFRKVLELNPGNLDVYVRLGTLYTSENRLEEAKRSYDTIAEHQQGHVAATIMSGMISELQNNRDEAKKRYEHALEMDARSYIAANNLANLYAEGGENLDVALRLAQTAKAGLPARAEASDTLGWIYFLKGMNGPATSALEEAARQAPNNPVIFYHLGLAQLKLGNRTAAKDSLERALRLSSTFKGAEEAKRTLTGLRS